MSSFTFTCNVRILSSIIVWCWARSDRDMNTPKAVSKVLIRAIRVLWLRSRR